MSVLTEYSFSLGMIIAACNARAEDVPKVEICNLLSDPQLENSVYKEIQPIRECRREAM